jgi:hypothetical protein
MRQSRFLVLVVSAVLLLVAATVGYVEWVPPSKSVTVSFCGSVLGASFRYDGNRTGFLSDGYGVSPTHCVTASVLPGSTLNLTLFVHSSDPHGAHQLLQVAVDPPFALTGLTPGVPRSVAPGGNVSFAAMLRVPSAPGSYDGPTATVTVD